MVMLGVCRLYSDPGLLALKNKRESPPFCAILIYPTPKWSEAKRENENDKETEEERVQDLRLLVVNAAVKQLPSLSNPVSPNQ